MSFQDVINKAKACLEEDLKSQLAQKTELLRKIELLGEKHPEAKPKSITICRSCGEKFPYMASDEFIIDSHVSKCGRDNYTGIECPVCGRSNWGDQSVLKTDTEWPFDEYGIK